MSRYFIEEDAPIGSLAQGGLKCGGFFDADSNYGL